MNKQLAGLRMKSVKMLPLLCLLSALTLLLPFVSVRAEGVSITGIEAIMKALNALAEQGFLVKPFVVLIFLLLPAVLLIGAGITVFVKKTKATVRLCIIAFVITCICAVGILFTSARFLNGSGLLENKFLVKNLGIGYWLFLILSTAFLAAAMKAAKINPGYIILCVMSVIWLFPIAWLVLISFRGEPGSYTSYFWPKILTFKNYQVLLSDSSKFQYVRWFGNTILVAACSCAISTFIVLSTAFVFSRVRFTVRKGLMNVFLILGMFPGFMSMIAVYYILKGMGLSQSLLALIMVYSGGSALGYYIVKGFFDTIPKALDEAARIDGATMGQIFTRITLPLSKPIIIYTILTSFMGPWTDYIFARVIIGDDYKNYTVALGLFTMLDRSNIDKWYTKFGAGAVLISIPIAILFISLQKYYVEGLSGSVKG